MMSEKIRPFICSAVHAMEDYSLHRRSDGFYIVIMLRMVVANNSLYSAAAAAAACLDH